MAVRAALGAGRGRLARQSLTESLALGLLGGAAGLVAARWGIDIIRALAPENLPVVGAGRLGLDTRVVLLALALSLVTSLVFGLLPAWQLAGQDVNSSLKDGSRASGGVRKRLRSALVVAEIALASLLLVGAGLTLRSFKSLLDTESGADTRRALTALVSLPPARYSGDPRILAAFDEIERRFTGVPGVRELVWPSLNFETTTGYTAGPIPFRARAVTPRLETLISTSRKSALRPIGGSSTLRT